MTKKILNNIDHQDLLIDTSASKAFGDHVNRSLALCSEYSDLHKEFPILLYKNPETKELNAHAILGFEKDENLFIKNDTWISHYVPACMARGPFSIGYQNREENGKKVSETVIMVDEDSPRCRRDKGEAVFLEHGGESPYLGHIKKVLHVIDTGVKSDKAFFSLLEDLDLLEEVSITITLNEDSHVGFKNYYTVSQERLMNIGGESLKRLNQSGFLGLIFFLQSSLGNFNKMIQLKNAKTAAAQ